MGLRDWWRRIAGGAPTRSPAIHEAVERVVQVINPRLRLVHRYQARLAPAIAAALEHVGQVVAAIPPARAAGVADWSTDPYLLAFFSSAQDMARAFSRSVELRAFFDANPAATEAWAVLGTDMAERRTLGMGLEGDQVRADVAQTTLNFSDHLFRLCAATEEALRAELGRRLVDQLAIEGLGKAAGDQTRREELARDRALLQTRLRLLQRQGAGMGALGGDAAPPGEQSRLAAEMQRNAEELGAISGGAGQLDWELERVREVLAAPAEALHVSARKLRIDRMNVLLESGAPEGAELEFQVARVPGTPPRTRAFALVRFPRADLLPPGQLLDEAARLLA